MMRCLFSSFFLGLFLIRPAICVGQSGDILDEIALGLAQRNQLLSDYPKVEDPIVNQTVQVVFQLLLYPPLLLNPPLVASRPPLPYEVTVIKHPGVNAFSTAGGKVYVTESMVPILGQDLGLWAAVLAHEIGHVVERHHYRAYLREIETQYQIAYYRMRAAQGDKSANWALLGYAIASGLGNLALSRDDEHDADRFGLMMMAEAGFHPDLAITLYRRMRKRGDQSRLGAFFSDHPRWVTREQRTMKAYQDALRVFESLWPNPDQSPGGVPPALATFGQISVKRDEVSKAAIVNIPVNIRNVKDGAFAVVILFSKNKKPVRAATPEYQLGNGSLGAFQTLTAASWNFTTTAALVVPSSALGTKDRKLDAKAFVIVGDEVIAESKPFEASFPKP